MEESQLIGIIIGLTNLIPGALLAYFYKPIGTKMSAVGQKLNLDKIVSKKLYEETFSQNFVLVIGIWLILFGGIAWFIFAKLPATKF